MTKNTLHTEEDSRSGSKRFSILSIVLGILGFLVMNYFLYDLIQNSNGMDTEEYFASKGISLLSLLSYFYFPSLICLIISYFIENKSKLRIFATVGHVVALAVLICSKFL